jgi:hypothetical protein
MIGDGFQFPDCYGTVRESAPPWLWSAWLWLFVSQLAVAMTSFFEFALALVIPGALLVLLAALLLTRST